MGVWKMASSTEGFESPSPMPSIPSSVTMRTTKASCEPSQTSPTVRRRSEIVSTSVMRIFSPVPGHDRRARATPLVFTVHEATVQSVPARRHGAMGSRSTSSVPDNGVHKRFCSGTCGRGEELHRLSLFHDQSLVHHHHAVGDLPREAHLVSDHHHRHAVGGE